MPPEYIAYLLAVGLVHVVTATALVARSRWRLCSGFAVYVAWRIAFSLCVALWPEGVRTNGFWAAANAVFRALTFWIGLEVAGHVLRSRSRVSAAARTAAVLGLGVIAVTAFVPSDYYDPWWFLERDTWRVWSLNGPLFVMLATWPSRGGSGCRCLRSNETCSPASAPT